MALTTDGKERILDKMLAVMEAGGSNVRINIGNSSYDGLGTFGNDVNCIGTGSIPESFMALSPVQTKT